MSDTQNNPDSQSSDVKAPNSSEQERVEKNARASGLGVVNSPIMRKLALEKARERRAANIRAFLAALSEVGNITEAAELVKVGRSTVLSWRNRLPGFREREAEAMSAAADRLEKEARRRAVEGVTEPIFQKGEYMGSVRKYSDTLLIYLLNGARPEKYRYQKHEHSGTISLEALVRGSIKATPPPAALPSQPAPPTIEAQGSVGPPRPDPEPPAQASSKEGS